MESFLGVIWKVISVTIVFVKLKKSAFYFVQNYQDILGVDVIPLGRIAVIMVI